MRLAFGFIRLSGVLALLALVLGYSCVSAWAQEGPPGVAPAAVVPPRVIEKGEVPYPENAQGDALVIVTLTVNADGSVRSANAETSQPPFSEVAVDSVKRWRFEPATRGGVPVAATIRMEIAFHAPVVSEAPSAEAAAPPASQTTPVRSAAPGALTRAPDPDAPIEVTVLGEQRAPMVASLGTTEVRQVPGAFGDPFRAIEILPGVIPFVSGLPYYYVRGAPPGNVGYYLDGIRVPYLFHIAIGPSVVHAGMVDRVDLYSGGYPARYGRYAGGIVGAETKAPNPTTRGEASIRIFDAGALVESSFDDGRGTFLLGGRYSYTGALLSLLTDDFKLDYRDYQARVSYDVSPKDQISLVAFGAYDLLSTVSKGVSSIAFGSEFYRAELRWDRSVGDGGRLRTAIMAGYDQTAIGGELRAQDRLGGARSELELPLSDSLRMRVGVDGQLDSYRVTPPVYDDPDTPASKRLVNLYPPREDAVTGGHAELSIELRRGFVVTPGIRVDRYLSGSVSAVGIDPRLSTKLQVSEAFAIVQTWGIAHQPPSFSLPTPALVPGSLAKGLQTAYQSSAGIEWHLAPATTLTSNVFYNVYRNLTDSMSVPQAVSIDWNARTSGRGYGLELFLHRSLTQNLGGFVSYTLSRSVRRLGQFEFPSGFDRRHVLNAAVAYNLGRRWRAGTRFMSYTGAPKPKTPPSATPTSEAPSTATGSTAHISDPEREPLFYRVDVRLEKLWQVGKTGHISFIAEVLNVTGSKENIGGVAFPVILPGIGVEGGF